MAFFVLSYIFGHQDTFLCIISYITTIVVLWRTNRYSKHSVCSYEALNVTHIVLVLVMAWGDTHCRSGTDSSRVNSAPTLSWMHSQSRNSTLKAFSKWLVTPRLKPDRRSSCSSCRYIQLCGLSDNEISCTALVWRKASDSRLISEDSLNTRSENNGTNARSTRATH